MSCDMFSNFPNSINILIQILQPGVLETMFIYDKFVGMNCFFWRAHKPNNSQVVNLASREVTHTIYV